MTGRTRLSLLLVAALLGVPACSSPWKENYAGARPGQHPPTDRVAIREVPWARVDETLRQIQRARAESPVHRDEWTEGQKLEEKATLLRGLQISQDPARVEILGRSVFRSTSAVSPLDGELEKFARELGADYAVWSSNYVGKADRIEREPVFRHGGSWGYDSDVGSRYRWRPYDDTYDVPVVVQADEYAWVVYYLRTR